MKKDALFIMGMGGPDSIEAIEPFLYNLFCDRDIIDFHVGSFLQKFIAKKIAKKRAKKLAPEYLKMGYNGASPQNIIHRKIFKKLESAYEVKTGRKLDIIEANCYYHPFFEEALLKLKENTYDNIIFTTVYPQYSMTTVEACFNRLGKLYNIAGCYPYSSKVISNWFENEKYCKAIVDRIHKAASKLNKDISECHILYSAHSVPLSYVEKGDPYPSQIDKHTAILNEMAGIKSFKIAYQSKVGPVKWMQPTMQDTLESYKEKDIDNIIIVPISFISDHIETLIEIDEQLIPIVKNCGKNIVRIESLNDSDDFIDALSDIIKLDN